METTGNCPKCGKPYIETSEYWNLQSIKCVTYIHTWGPKYVQGVKTMGRRCFVKGNPATS